MFLLYTYYTSVCIQTVRVHRKCPYTIPTTVQTVLTVCVPTYNGANSVRGIHFF